MADFPDVDKVFFLVCPGVSVAEAPVSSPVLMANAALMYQKLHLQDGTCEMFKAGTSWLKCAFVAHVS